MKRPILISAMAISLISASCYGRDITQYIDWGPTSHQFPTALAAWTPGQQLTEDDNFFISRVRPKSRFVNLATQVHTYLTPDVDKNLIYWVPIGTPPHNGLPTDRFDSDVFSMWSYVTHFGDWSAPMARIPGNFSDAAHRNGVGVSPVLSTPWGALTAEWGITLRDMLATGPEKMSEFLDYYGIDGLGYNSEFSLYNNQPAENKPGSVTEISDFNAEITRLAAEKGNPVFMNIWYDGTASNGSIMFDRGLADHNYDTFGRGDKIASSLFFNYNWNNVPLMTRSVENARSIGRNPLDLYVGFNMQGGEPAKTKVSWTLLKDYPLSIGLWGAHSESMMYESRREFGTSPLAIQQTYLSRTEWWFSGGTRNPASAPEIEDFWHYAGKNTGFFGMAKLMSARSALTGPFVTNFNLGNGTFFNYKGLRRSDTEWANIGMQDILPTWRYWWSDKLLGHEATDVPDTGLDASFTWDDAWLGGSSLRISGSLTAPEYLHLFKTQIPLSADDNISIRYKHVGGHATMRLILTAEGAEDQAIETPIVLDYTDYANEDWHLATYSISDIAPSLVGKNLALVALRFDNAKDLNLLLGSFGITSTETAAPATPIISRTELLYAGTEGVDGKIVWDMPNGSQARYNEDQNVSFFQLYAQQEGCEPILQSGTSSWAGLLLSTPLQSSAPMKMRFGVAAVSADYSCESDIAWGEWHDFSDSYTPSHAIVGSKAEAYVGTPVVFSFADTHHPAALWTVTDAHGDSVISDINDTHITFTPQQSGIYSVSVTYTDENGQTCQDTYDNMLYALDRNNAGAPEITDFDWHLAIDEPGQADADDNVLVCSYEANANAGKRSRAIKLDGRPFGITVKDLVLKNFKDYSIAFWLCPGQYTNDETHLVSIRDKSDSWSKNEWGWLWSTIGKDGKGITVTIRRNGIIENTEMHFPDVYLAPGVWNHVGYSFDFNGTSLEFSLYINGEKVPVSYYVENSTRYEGAPDPITGLYTWRQGNVISVGGTLFKQGGVEGALDNFTYWNTTLSDGRGALAAADIDPANAPDGLMALYSFDEEPGDELAFVNEIKTSTIADVKAGSFCYIPKVVEGSGTMQYVSSVFCGGAPQLTGTHDMETQVKWIAPGTEMVLPHGDAESGSARLIYAAPGNYKVKLRLENLNGYDEREVNMIFVPATGGVDAIKATPVQCMNQVTIAPHGVVALHFEKSGSYTIDVMTMDGKSVYTTNIVATAGMPHSISGLPTATPLLVRVR